jgi:HK97 family phage major capsid protein
MPEEILTKEELQQGLEAVKAAMNEAIAEKMKGALEKSEASVKAASDRIEAIEKEKGELEAQLNALEVKMKDMKAPNEKQEHFNDVLAKAIQENADKLKSFSKGQNLALELKAVGDMSTANFDTGVYANLTTDFRQSPLPLPTERIWMRNVLPSGTTNAGNIWYPRHTGGEGGAAPWNTGNKPQIDFDFDGVNAPVEWIAGFVKIPRAMLDDVAWMTSFLQQNMLLSLYKAENNQILNGNGTSPQLKGIIPQATAYDGDYTVAVERIIDAGYGQVNENEGNANLALLHPRDAVAIILNKASGSGEYDLPPGTIGFVNNRLTIAGMNVVQTKEITQGNFLVGDNMASQFVTRLSPELRVFEQNEDDAKKNMVMFRIEERAALATYYPTWWVKGTLAATT